MSGRALLTPEELALRFALDAAQLRRLLPGLYRRGFPQPLPLRGVVRWDPRAVDLWLDRFLGPPVHIASPAGSEAAGSPARAAAGFLPPAANDRDAAAGEPGHDDTGDDTGDEPDAVAAVLARRARALAGEEP